MERPRAARHHEVVSLFWRVFAINAAVLVAAVAVLALSPATVSSRIEAGEVAVLGVGVAARARRQPARCCGACSRPLEQLTALMHRVDPLAPGRRIAVERRRREVGRARRRVQRHARPARGRAPRERPPRARRAGGRAAADRARAPRRDRPDAHRRGPAARDARAPRARRSCARSCGRSRRRARGPRGGARIARRLRPEALDELGLRARSSALGSGSPSAAASRVAATLDGDLPALGPEDELVVYRVAQEASTNVVRHAGASRVELELERDDGARRAARARRRPRHRRRRAAPGAGGSAACASARCSSAASSTVEHRARRTAPRSRLRLPGEQ